MTQKIRPARLQCRDTDPRRLPLWRDRGVDFLGDIDGIFAFVAYDTASDIDIVPAGGGPLICSSTAATAASHSAMRA